MSVKRPVIALSLITIFACVFKLQLVYTLPSYGLTGVVRLVSHQYCIRNSYFYSSAL